MDDKDDKENMQKKIYKSDSYQNKAFFIVKTKLEQWNTCINIEDYIDK